MGTPSSVSYFFISSGFLLAYNYSERVDAGRMNYRAFMLGRCARLLPVYYLGLLVAFPLLFWPTRIFWPRQVALTALLLQAWVPGSVLYWNPPGWALSNLAFFYLIVPLLLILTRTSSRSACLGLAAAAWLLSVGLSIAYVYWNPDGLRVIRGYTSGFWLDMLRVNPIARLPEFFLGVLAGRLFLKTGGLGPRRSTVVFFASSAVLAALLLIGPRLPFPVANSGWLAPLLALIVFSLASGGLGARLFEPRWFVVLGQSSFCLYMLHVPLWNLAKQIAAPYRRFRSSEEVALVLIIVLSSVLLFKWVETPATSAMRRRLLPDRPQARLS